MLCQAIFKFFSTYKLNSNTSSTNGRLNHKFIYAIRYVF